MKSLRTLVVAGWVFFGREGEEGESQGWFRKAGVGKSINLSERGTSLPTITRPLFSPDGSLNARSGRSGITRRVCYSL